MSSPAKPAVPDHAASSAAANPTPPSSSAAAAAAATTTGPNAQQQDGGEDEPHLRKELRSRLHNLYRRGPLDPTYKHLLQRTQHAAFSRNRHHAGRDHHRHHHHQQGNVIKFPRDKLYKRVNAELRRSVESYLANPNSGAKKRGRERRVDLEDNPMRTAFTLREYKKHEQESLVAAAVASDVYAGQTAVPYDKAQILARKRRLEGTAVMLQEQERRQAKLESRMKTERARAVERARLVHERERIQAEADLGRFREEREKVTRSSELHSKVIKLKEEEIRKKEEDLRRRQEQMERELAERERELAQEKAREREKQREVERKKEEEERRKSLEREKEEAKKKEREKETPQQVLRRLYDPIFQALWNMEFENLHRTNPFRIVIDAENQLMMGVPDYCDVIRQPMNLTYIQEKVQNSKYESLQQFFSDVELMINNALLYNSDPTNPYHLAAKEMKRKYKKMAKRVVTSLQQQQQKSRQQQN